MAILDKYKIHVLFHGSEPELSIFSKNRELIESRNIFLPINPPEVISICMDKQKTNKCLEGLGFNVPRFLVVNNIDDLKKIDWFPVVVKPSLGGGGSANVFIAQNFEELEGLALYLHLDNKSNNFLIQEYVGTPEEEYTVGILHDMNGNYLNSIAVKRYMTGQLNIRSKVPNRTSDRFLGNNLVISSGVSQGQIGRFPLVTQQCREIAKSIGSRGPLNIQCRLVNGSVRVFEINPRFSGTTSLRAMVGYNEPDVLIRRHILQECIEVDFDYQDGVILRSLIETRVA